jgi:hypothetical protein
MVASRRLTSSSRDCPRRPAAPVAELDAVARLASGLIIVADATAALMRTGAAGSEVLAPVTSDRLCRTVAPISHDDP